MLYIDHDEYVTARVMSVWSRQFVEVVEFLVDGRKHMIEVTVIKRRCLAASGWRTRQKQEGSLSPLSAHRASASWRATSSDGSRRTVGRRGE